MSGETRRRNPATGNTLLIREGGWTGWIAALEGSCECGAWHEVKTAISAPDIPFAACEGMLDDMLSDALAACRETCGS